jgi:hypothetical protein
MPKPTPGRVVYVLVHPDNNNGRDAMPATITGVNETGTVNAIGHPDVPGQTGVDLRDVTVVADRKAALAELGKHTEHLRPVRRVDDGERPYKPVDAAAWVKVGYWPERDDAPAGPAKAAKKSAAKKTAPVKTTAPAPAAV